MNKFARVMRKVYLFYSALKKHSKNRGEFHICKQSINRHYHMKDRVDRSHLTKLDTFRVNRDQVLDLDTWFKIHTNVSTVKTAPSKAKKLLKVLGFL